MDWIYPPSILNSRNANENIFISLENRFIALVESVANLLVQGGVEIHTQLQHPLGNSQTLQGWTQTQKTKKSLAVLNDFDADEIDQRLCLSGLDLVIWTKNAIHVPPEFRLSASARIVGKQEVLGWSGSTRFQEGPQSAAVRW